MIIQGASDVSGRLATDEQTAAWMQDLCAAAQQSLLFSQISKIEIAAGVMPEMREAWPMEFGL